MIFFRLSFVSLCLLSNKMFLYMLKDLSTSTLAVGQYLNMATSPGPMSSGKVAAVPESTPAMVLMWSNPEFFFQHFVQFALQLLASFARDPGQLALDIFHQLHSIDQLHALLLELGDVVGEKARLALKVWLLTSFLLSSMALASSSSNWSRMSLRESMLSA